MMLPPDWTADDPSEEELNEMSKENVRMGYMEPTDGGHYKLTKKGQERMDYLLSMQKEDARYGHAAGLMHTDYDDPSQEKHVT